MHANILIGVIQQDIGAGLRDRHGANFDLGGSGGEEGGDTAVLEAYLHVGKVFLAGVYRPAQSLYALNGGRNEPQNDVNIVNHQVQNYPVVLDARDERTQASALDHQGFVDDLLQFLHRAVKALNVPDVQDHVPGFGQVKQVAGFVHGVGNGLFEEDVYAGIQEIPGNGMVQGGRNGDADGVHFVNEVVVIGIGSGVVLLSGAMRATVIDVGNAYQIDVGQLTVKPHVIPPHVPNTDNADSQVLFHCSPSPSVSWLDDLRGDEQRPRLDRSMKRTK